MGFPGWDTREEPSENAAGLGPLTSSGWATLSLKQVFLPWGSGWAPKGCVSGGDSKAQLTVKGPWGTQQRV